MKNFNQVEDKMLNELAVEYANGNVEAGERFMELVQPKLKNLAKKKHSELSKEDLTQEFLMESVKACYEYADRYSNDMNIMALIWKKCRQRHIDLGRGDGAEKRSKTMTIGDDVVNRVKSLNAPVGPEGTTDLGERLAITQKSVEESLTDSLNKTVVERVVSEFVGSTKGRNGSIVALVYKSLKQDWTEDELKSEISKVLFNEKGVKPTDATIRKAKSRAMESIRKAILDGKIESVNALEWEF